MPNGHGGIPRFGSPMLLLFFMVVLAAVEGLRHPDWARPAALGLAAVFGWRLAWHVVMYPIMWYDGAYASAAELEAARRRYRVVATITVLASIILVGLAWRVIRPEA